MVKWNKFPIAFFFNECLCVTSFGEKHESLRRCGWLPHSITTSLYHRSFHHQHRYTRVVRRKPSQWHRSASLFFRDLCTRQLLLKWRHGTASGGQTLLPGNWHSALFTSIRAPIFVPGSSGRLIFRPVLMGPCSQPVFSFFARCRKFHLAIDPCLCCFLWAFTQWELFSTKRLSFFYDRILSILGILVL